MFQPDLFASEPAERPARMPSGECPQLISAERIPSQADRNDEGRHLGLPEVLERLAGISSRPRYTFMVLNLIARAAGSTNSAGPYVQDQGQAVAIRDWLTDALVPMAQRDPRRLAIEKRLRTDLARDGRLPAEPALAEELFAAELRARLRHSGRTNVSRAVSDLVRAGLLHRHYQGYRVDHQNRGAQREAVYTIAAGVRGALGRPA